MLAKQGMSRSGHAFLFPVEAGRAVTAGAAARPGEAGLSEGDGSS